ncbi:hypothetical protein ACLKA6_016832 [Drosophila palustris]
MFFKPEFEDNKDKKLIQATIFRKGKDNNNVIEVPQTSKAYKREFLEETDQIEISKHLFDSECAAELENFDVAVHDAWLLQCPKGMDLSAALSHKRIKMPGRRYVDNLQVRATHFAEPSIQSVGFVNAKGKYALRRMPLAGHMIVSKRLNMEKPSDAADDADNCDDFPKQCKPQKFRLPVRHPFFGRNFKERIELNKKTSKRLRHAQKKSDEATIKSRTTFNYYSLRSKMLSTTQTLEQKEHDIRQSVLTGAHSNYVDLTSIAEEDDDEDKQKEGEEEKKKQRKRKANGVDKSVSNVDDDQQVQESSKKKKKRKTEETAT